jgi:6-phosphofructokinase
MAENIHMSALQNEVLCLVVIGGDGGSGGVE